MYTGVLLPHRRDAELQVEPVVVVLQLVVASAQGIDEERELVLLGYSAVAAGVDVHMGGEPLLCVGAHVVLVLVEALFVWLGRTATGRSWMSSLLHYLQTVFLDVHFSLSNHAMINRAGCSFDGMYSFLVVGRYFRFLLAAQ